MIRIALVCTAAVLLSGCSWIGGWGGGGNAGRKMNLELAVGVDRSIDGDLIKTAFDTGGTAELTTTDYNDAYGTNLRYELGGSYAVSDTVDVTASVNYSKASGKTLDVGNVAAVDPITAEFGDVDTYGAEIGVRKYFRNSTFASLLSPAVSPYVGVKAGIQRIESTDAVLTSAGFAGIGQPASITTQLYDDSYVPTGEITVGAEWRASRNFAIGLETGIRYKGDLNSGTNTFAAIGWEEADSHAENISIPVTLRGRFKF